MDANIAEASLLAHVQGKIIVQQKGFVTIMKMLVMQDVLPQRLKNALAGTLF